MSPGLPAGKGLGGTYRSASDTILNSVKFAGALVEEGAAVVVVGASVVVSVVTGVVADATVTAAAVVFGGIAEVSDAPFVVLAHAEAVNTRATRTRRRMSEPYSFRHTSPSQWCRRYGLAADVRSDELDDGVAVALTFGGPDAGDAFEFVNGGRCDVG